MAANLIVVPEAELDVMEAYAWYEKQRVGLGEEFLNSVDACIQRICRAPTIHRPVHENYRRSLLRRFPYAVFYEYSETETTVTVYCVCHTARDPEKWRLRLP